jgi:two-component system sensor histidine kinase DesK
VSPQDELSARGLRRLRTYTFFTVIGCGPMVLFMAAMFMVGSGLDGTDLALAAGAVTVSVVLCTSALALYWHGRELWRQRVLWSLSLLVLVLGAIVDARAGVGGDVPVGPISDAWAAPAGLLGAAFALWSKPGRRARALIWATAAALVVGAVLAQVGLYSRPSVFILVTLVVAVGVTVVCQLWHYQVAVELEKARGLAAELAVAEERLRFAGELHDIQGGNLQAITLKAQVARRLVAVDPERAEAEMRGRPSRTRGRSWAGTGRWRWRTRSTRRRGSSSRPGCRRRCPTRRRPWTRTPRSCWASWCARRRRT